MAKKKLSRTAKFRLFYVFFIPGVILSSIYINQDTEAKLTELKAKKEAALTKQHELEKERDYLEHKIELLDNPNYFQSYAKRKLLYTSEGEILFIFPAEY